MRIKPSKKRIISLIGLLLVIIVFVSCSKKPSIPECRVGIVMPTTGEMVPYGTEGIIAARIALKHAQEDAKYSKPKLYEQDSASDPTGANTAASTLLAPPSSVHIIIGEINSANTAAMISQARIAKIPILAPTASSITLTSMSDLIFRIWPSDSYEAKIMSEHLQSKGVDKVGVLYIQVPYGEEMAKFFQKEFTESGGEVHIESYRKETLDFKPLLLRMKSFENIYIISYIEDAALILKQAHDVKELIRHKFNFFGTSVLDSIKLIQKAGIATEGLIFAVVQPGEEGDKEKRKRFISEYKQYRTAQSGVFRNAAEDPSFAGFHVYDAIRLAFKAGDSAGEANDISGLSIMRNLKLMQNYFGVTGEIKFDENGDLAADRRVIFKQIRDGAINPIIEK